MGKLRYIPAVLVIVVSLVGVGAPRAEAGLLPIKVGLQLPLPPPSCADLTTIEFDHVLSTGGSTLVATPLLAGFGCAGDRLTLTINGVPQSSDLDGSAVGTTFRSSYAGSAPLCASAEVTRTTQLLGLVAITQVLDRLPDSGCIAIPAPLNRDAPVDPGCRKLSNGTVFGVLPLAAPSCPDVTYSVTAHTGEQPSVAIAPVISAGAVSGVSGLDPVLVPAHSFPSPEVAPTIWGRARASREESVGAGETARFAYSSDGYFFRVPPPPPCEPPPPPEPGQPPLPDPCNANPVGGRFR